MNKSLQNLIARGQAKIEAIEAEKAARAQREAQLELDALDNEKVLASWRKAGQDMRALLPEEIRHFALLSREYSGLFNPHRASRVTIILPDLPVIEGLYHAQSNGFASWDYRAPKLLWRMVDHHNCVEADIEIMVAIVCLGLYRDCGC